MQKNIAVAASIEVNSARTYFYWIFIVTFLLKIWLAMSIPMTADEAFFYQWGLHLDWGYYDHPPMIGWWLYLLNKISDYPLVLRSLTVLLTHVIALGVIDLGRRLLLSSKQLAAPWLAGSLYLALPISWVGVLVTTDTPMIFFVFCSAYCFLRSGYEPRVLWSLACGAFLGLALLSKYFAALLALAYGLSTLCQAERLKGIAKLALIALMAAPFVGVNIVYNATHCWSNIMFNLVNRHEGAQWSLYTVIGYLLLVAYVVTPWVVRQLWSARRRLLALQQPLMVALIPLTVFLLFSLKKTIGLHWLLGFLPFLYVLAGAALPQQALRRSLCYTILLSVPHCLFLIVLLSAPLSIWSSFSFYKSLVFLSDADKVAHALQQGQGSDTILMARAYAPAAMLSYYAERYVPVFGSGRFHARQDDVIVDFRAYAGKNMRIFDRAPMRAEEFIPYFAHVRLGSVEVSGIRYWYADGRRFNYPVYRERVLREIVRQYYRFPQGWPIYGCPFLERYGFGTFCVSQSVK